MRVWTGALLLLASGALAQDASSVTGEARAEDLVISLATFGPGDELASWFGHSALVVEDRRLGRGRLYNYGMFGFAPDTLVRYALGRLVFWVDEAPVLGTYRAYMAEGRTVRVQELDLSPDRRAQLARFLANNVLPENREYLYNHYDDNCSTRPRDALDRALGGKLHDANRMPARLSLRDHTRRHTAVSPAMSVLLDFALNSDIDRPVSRWAEAFLPAELERQVAAFTYSETGEPRKPLVRASSTLSTSARPPVPEHPPGYGPWLLALGAFIGATPVLLAALRGPSMRAPLGLYHALTGLVFGLPGTLLLIMWLATDHVSTHHNENLFLANPATLALLPTGIAFSLGARWASRLLRPLCSALLLLGVLGLLCKALPLFDQDNWRLIALILPALAGLWLSSELDLRARSKSAV